MTKREAKALAALARRYRKLAKASGGTVIWCSKTDYVRALGIKKKHMRAVVVW